ncbi:hypothetical protein CYFUS_001702 [Cystobacter fuscus]|uniref:Uncharacterized protein n=1 Tax=Cystobacter fuscus TaxID=43 RepID=A0A250IYH0_9BACT|nr:hypothetical protein [Cystobacter fuscus]ATB36288.1 hypothetical protein CYFUS_001702 [Cystobacter fuscus]
MAVGAVVAVGGAAAVAAAGAWVATREGGTAAAPAVAPTPKVAAPTPVPTVEKPPSGAPAPVPVPAASGGTGILGDVVNKAAEKGLTTLLGSSAATVTMGLQATDAMRQVVTAIAGAGAGNTTAVFGAGAGLGFVAREGVEAVGSALGVPAEISRRVAQTVGVAVADPTGILTSLKVTGEVVSLGIRAVAGADAERAVRDVVAKLDITDPRNAVHAPVAAVASAVSAAANVVKNGVTSLFKGLFGK